MFILLASLCSGLAAGCFFLLLADLLGKVSVDEWGDRSDLLLRFYCYDRFLHLFLPTIRESSPS